jgi:hypothetical protein
MTGGVRVPTSVLLAVLAAAGLLALAPALVRRYDATERLVAERALSTARVLARAGAQAHRRRRTVPGRRPVNPPRFVVARMTAGVSVAASAAVAASTAAAVAAGSAAAALAAGVVEAASAHAGGQAPARSGGRVPARPGGGLPARPGGGLPARAGGAAGPRRMAKRAPRRLRHPRAVYRRRRVFAALVLLNVVELVGVAVVGPGFWVGAAVTGLLLFAYLVHLRNRAMLEQRRRRAEARYAAWIAARQAAVRREQARRVAARREALRRQLLEREEARRQAARQGAVRGRPYEARAVGQDW